MSTTQIVSKKLHVSSAADFIYSVKNDDAYYVFAAKHTAYDNGDSSVPTPSDSVGNNLISIYDDMLFGKRVLSSDVIAMIPRYDWSSGTVYAMYDDQDANLHSKQYYACVNTGSQYQVYKCLYNGANAASTVEPTGTDNDAFEFTTDGYIWKYMYSAPSATEAKFATTQYLPVVVNTSVTAAAAPGSIEVIKVEDGGSGYRNYLVSSFEKIADIKINGDEYRYGLPAAASEEPDIYNNCLLLMTSGDAQDQYRVITDYSIVGSQRVAILNEPFANTPGVNDTFEIYPLVDVFDTGGVMQTNCIARAMISSSSSNSISKVEVITPGTGYRSAIAVIRPDGVVGVSSNASLRAIISPADGHGAHVEDELGANYAGIAVKFIEGEGVAPEFLTDNDFRQVGILKNPLFANVQIDFSTSVGGNFLANENILQYKAKQLSGTANVTGGSATITGNDTLFTDWLNQNDKILLSDGTTNHFASVSTITSNTQITVNAAAGATVTMNQCNVFYMDTVSFGKVSANSSGVIYVANVNVASVSTSTKFIGEQSFTTINADDVQLCRGGSTPAVRNANNYYTFSQLTKFVGTLDEGTFQEDEYVTQSSASYAQPTARVFSAGENYMYVTNVKNVWQVGAGDGVSAGNTSAAVFTITAKYDGELIAGSGEVLYIENLSPISRSSTQTETIKLILEF
jgi:hypothetical protein